MLFFWLIGEGSDLVPDLPQNLLICLFQHCLLADTATMLEYVHRPEKRVVARQQLSWLSLLTKQFRSLTNYFYMKRMKVEQQDPVVSKSVYKLVYPTTRRRLKLYQHILLLFSFRALYKSTTPIALLSNLGYGVSRPSFYKSGFTKKNCILGNFVIVGLFYKLCKQALNFVNK